MCALYFWKSRLIIKEGGLIRSYGLMEFSSNSSPHVPSPLSPSRSPTVIIITRIYIHHSPNQLSSIQPSLLPLPQ